MKKPFRSFKKPSKSSFLLIIAFIIGLSIFLYPIVMQIYSGMTQTRVIDTYQDSLDKLSQEEIDAYKNQITQYNRQLSGDNIQHDYEDPFSDEPSNEVSAEGDHSSFNVFTDRLGDVLGHIDIPAIDGKFPIYAGTSDAVLQKGIGYMENTSFPLGGEGTHAVLTGHRGLPTSKLFTDLPDVELGSIFYLNVLDETLAYQVTEINTVLPYETDLIAIQEGRDLVTLITCTPYMINSHRLLVMGERIPYTPEEPVAAAVTPDLPTDSTPEETSYPLPILIASVVSILVLALLIYKRKTRKEKR
ncbi:sortase A [Alkalibacterium subtropicum]|uniref:Sortase A n=1 Tax=Alkalibacterium subtropicum TaxID=753702 RepID=A0A1I1JHX9_9LACT|nr:class C sortase [Alkalibacterium subtropicum]SFC47965.1 sortase A [Alkalibacterium subtropicum]